MNIDLTSLDSYIDALRTEYQLPSISAAVTLGTALIWQGACGFVDLQARRPTTPEHVYPIGSDTKVFVTTALLQLVEQRVVNLEDPVAKFLPEYQVNAPWPNLPPTTLRQLAAHTSGLPRDAAINFPMNFSLGQWAASGGHTPLQWYETTERVLASLSTVQLELPPETGKNYSNLGIMLLGIALGRACGEDIRSYIRRSIFQPLQMESAGWLDDPDAWDERFPTGYARPLSGGEHFATPPWQLNCAIYTGGIYATPTDLAKFVAAQFRRDGLPLQPDNLLRMRHPSAFGDTTLGWWKGQHAGHANFGHSGAHVGFMTTALAIDALELGVAVATNQFTLFDNHATEIAQKLLAHLAPRALQARQAVFEPEKVNLAAYTGSYALDGNFAYLTITMKEGQLCFRLDGVESQEMLLAPVGPHQFGLAGNPIPMITFRTRPTGEVVSLNYALFEFRRSGNS